MKTSPSSPSAIERWTLNVERWTLAAFLAAIFLPSCASDSTTGNQVVQNASAFAKSPAGVALANTLITAAMTAGQQYATAGKIDGQALAGAALYGAAANMRPLVNTPAATSPRAISESVAIGANIPGISRQLPPIVAGSVVRQIQSGVPPAQAIENVATVMDVAALTATKSSGAP